MLAKKKVFNKLTTENLMMVPEQKKDARQLFTSIPLNKEHKIETFQMIGMTDPIRGTPD